MTITTLASREMNQDVGRAKGAAANGPVIIITYRGRPAHVLLSLEDHRRLSGRSPSMMVRLGMPGLAGAEFDSRPVRIQPRVPHFD